MITSLASLAGILLGVAISAGIVLVQGGLSAGSTARLQWTTFLALGLAIASWLANWIVRAGRDRMLRANGVAYLLREHAQDWAEDSTDDFYAEVRDRFASVVPVPRSEKVGKTWEWPLDRDARLWDGRVDDLVRTFRVLLNSVHDGNAGEGRAGVPDSIFVTAWWAVALAFGRRLRGGIRNWEPSIWQRPSDARAGTIRPDLRQHRPLRFTELSPPAPDGLAPLRLTWTADLTAARLPGSSAVLAVEPVSILLLRFGRGRWGPLELADPGGPLPLTLQDAGEVIPLKESARVLVHELRCAPRDGDQFFRWTDYPYLAALAVEWLQAKAAELPGHALLLGATMPNEVALGIGLLAGRPACDGWPERLWPVIFRPATRTLVTARLDLGVLIAADQESGEG